MSTDKQEELSPDAQKRLLMDYAKSHDLSVDPAYIFIENGVSGRKADKRPEFQKMISLAKSDEKPFSSILVWKFSRFARNQEESIVYKSMLKKQHGVDVVSITEPLIDGPFGSLVERIIEWMDEYYSINLSGEVLRGMTEKAMRGGYQSAPSLGYTSPAPGQPFVIVPEEAETVQYIFDQYVSHHRDLTAIARALNRRGILTKRGNHFERRNIDYILRNRFYIGKVVWNGIERDGMHETFLSDELFEEANARLSAEFRPIKRRSVSACKHYMSGLVKCSVCGASLGYNGSRDKFFNCWKYAKGIHQGSSYIASSKLEKSVLSYFEKLLSDQEFSFSCRSPAAEKKKDNRKLCQRELEKLSGREVRIKEAYEAGIDTLEEYQKNKERLIQARERLMEWLHTGEKDVSRDPEADKKAMLSSIRTVYDILKEETIDGETKGVFLRSVLEEVTWNREENSLTFHLYTPGNP